MIEMAIAPATAPMSAGFVPCGIYVMLTDLFEKKIVFAQPVHVSCAIRSEPVE
jgi:hypothetical protein